MTRFDQRASTASSLTMGAVNTHITTSAKSCPAQPLVPARQPHRRGVRALLRAAFAAVAAVAAVAALCAPAEGVPLASGPLTAAQQRQILEQIDAVGRRGFLYEVVRPGAAGAASNKLFLYGTIHLGRVGSEPFNGPLLTALRQSKRLALEADPTDTARTQALALQLGRYGDGDRLQSHVSPALMARVRAFGEKSGMPIDQVGRFKPWLLANMVALNEMNGAGLDPALGSELYLSGFARGLRMPIVEVEGLEAQLRMLAALPDALQTAQLEEALSDVDSNEAQNDGKTLFDLWLRGDGSACAALVDEMHRDDGTKVFERYFIKALIDQRNRTMADKAESYLGQPGNTFFAVGSLHLFGDAGLIREFERRGYRVVDLQPALVAGP
ncbi:MAG: TraB/GumN family protein [Burkholderiaceae bacterium]